MTRSIHGHEVLHLILESPAAFTKASLEAAIHRQFGPEARFHTCSAEGMTARELIDFLESRGKFVPAQGGFTTDPAKICNGEGHDHED